MSRLAPGFVFLLAAAALAPSAIAAPIVYANRASFDAAYPNAGVENWDGFANGTIFSDGTGANGIIYNSSAGDALVTNSFLFSTSPNGLGDTAVGFFQAGDSITFTFAQPIDVFGIDVNTFANLNGSYSALTNTGELFTSFFDPFPTFTTGQFLGFQAMNPFTSVTISTGSGFAYSLDTLRFFRTPEPASLLAWGLISGVGFIGYRFRQSRRRKVAA